MSGACVVEGYSGLAGDQLHWRKWQPDAAAGETIQPDLFCLHPSPFSGLAYRNLAPHLAKNRRVFAPDYLGYGGSDRGEGEPSIEGYVRSMLSLIDELTGQGQVDLLGFHTGCFVAAEIALLAPKQIRTLCLPLLLSRLKILSTNSPSRLRSPQS